MRWIRDILLRNTHTNAYSDLHQPYGDLQSEPKVTYKVTFTNLMLTYSKCKGRKVTYYNDKKNDLK